ncbi:MAG: hypothetical protein JWM59_1568 [Verrucomicrobiales bacterium]|nr:hypothetical protein [Verrucomicrobiales bacterium]
MSRRTFILLALLPALIYVAFHFLSPSRQLAASQNRLLSAIASKNAETVGKLLDPNYSDQWGFQSKDWPGILQDLRTLAPVLEITAREPHIDADNGVVETLLTVKGQGPAAESMQTQAATLKNTRFIWKRASWTPWSWRLTGIQNPDIEIPSGYTPGRIADTAGF